MHWLYVLGVALEGLRGHSGGLSPRYFAPRPAEDA
jgi:hypothetical protein